MPSLGDETDGLLVEPIKVGSWRPIVGLSIVLVLTILVWTLAGTVRVATVPVGG